MQEKYCVAHDSEPSRKTDDDPAGIISVPIFVILMSLLVVWAECGSSIRQKFSRKKRNLYLHEDRSDMEASSNNGAGFVKIAERPSHVPSDRRLNIEESPNLEGNKMEVEL